MKPSKLQAVPDDIQEIQTLIQERQSFVTERLNFRRETVDAINLEIKGAEEELKDLRLKAAQLLGIPSTLKKREGVKEAIVDENIINPQ